MSAAITALLNETDLDRVQENWSNLDADADYVTTYRISGRDLTTKMLNDLWTVRAHRTVTTVRVFGDRAGSSRVAGLVRFHTDAPLTHPPLLALQPVGGGLQVLQLQLAPAVRDAVEEVVAEAARAVVVDAGDHVALRREHMVVPAVVEGVAAGRVRAAVGIARPS